MKTVDFSETIAASDLKVSGSRHLIDFMEICEYGPRLCTYKILRNYCVDLNQTLYASFQVQGNENLMI